MKLHTLFSEAVGLKSTTVSGIVAVLIIGLGFLSQNFTSAEFHSSANIVPCTTENIRDFK